jgi:hypothetical protein
MSEHGLHKLLGVPLTGAAVAALAFSGCASNQLRLPTQPPMDGGGAALLGPATLVVDTVGTIACVSAEADGQRYALVWPNGYYAMPTTPLTILDSKGSTVARVADTIWLGGGLAPGPWPELEDCPTNAGHVWWVADVSHTAP